jgi:hypothetical protein
MSRLSVGSRHDETPYAITLYGVPGKMTRRLLGVVIGTQGLVVFFGALVARALAAAKSSHTSGTFLLIGSLLAVLCILDAGLLRQPWGVTVGWVLQIATLASAFIVPLMLLVGMLFGALWLTAMVQGRNMDEHARVVDAQWHAAQETAEQQTSGTQASEQQTSEQQTSEQQTSEQQTSDPRTSAQDG